MRTTLSNQFNMSHLTSKFRSTPTISFKGRHQTITQSNRIQAMPSPQQYNIDNLSFAKNIKKSVKFPREQRISSLKGNKEMPGPGAYESNSVKGMISFHKGEVLRKGPNRFGEEGNSANPAPGHYHILERKYSTPEFSMGKVQRSPKQLIAAKSNPPPGIYTPRYNTQQHSISVSFAHSKRKPNLKHEKIPGPGSYETEKPFLSTSFNQKKEILSMARRYSTSSLEVLPGPGSYRSSSLFAEERIKKIGFTMRKGAKIPLLAGTTPGPGQYEASNLLLRFKRHQGVSIARSERSFLKVIKRSTSTPGPGDHQSFCEGESKYKSVSSNKFSKSKVPRFSKFKQNNFDFMNPEKLNYSKASTPSFSMSQSKRKTLFEEELKKDLPDKFYNSNIDLTKRSNNGFKIPKSLSYKDPQPSEIGPGYYNSESDFLPNKKMKFSKQRRSSFIDQMVKSKLSTFKGETYQSREEFPNPPKYMNVSKKIKINEKKMGGY